MAYQKRLKKEYEEMSKRAPVGISLDPSTMEDNIDM
jgi:ubiquitin-protein ligase